jgi:hypothetical protein
VTPLPPIKQVTDAVRSSATPQPKTVLGFLWAIFATDALGVPGIIWALNRAGADRYIGLVLLASAVVGAVSLGAAVVGMFLAPTKLMLLPLSGQEFTEHYRTVTLGDNEAGERRERIPSPQTVRTVDVAVEGIEARELPTTSELADDQGQAG